ncbi:MAG TPA: asparagine synthase (glutamine-hydrolyzing) [Candidatus Paceibacterota bacterium]
MCGITGSINFKGSPVDEEIIKRMTNTMVHRGPDDAGFFRDAHIAFGFRRLSIIDITGGHQPISNEDNSIRVICNGEIYNYQELRETLQKKGHVFTTESDTEVIVHGYEVWGEDCVKYFAGMFAFALYDTRAKKIILARDRMGKKPLYYAVMRGELIFASEMKAILAHPHFDRTPSLTAISSYLTFRYPQWDQPVFANAKRLPAGHILIITPETRTLKKYWEIPFIPHKEDRGEKYYLEQIGELLTRAVKRRMMSDVPIGAYLSGGLDSSIVVALMSKLGNTRPQTFSTGFPEEGYNERPFAELVAKNCGADHRFLSLTRGDYAKLLLETIRIKDAPLSIPHEIALWQMSRELKKYVTVVLSGEGADELFGGYGRVQRSPMDYKKIEFVRRHVPRALQAQTLAYLGAGKQAREWLAVKNPLEHLFYVYNWIPYEEKWSLLTDEAQQTIQNDREERERWKALFESIKDGNPYDRVLYFFEKYHLACLLDRLDSMSMAASVEARAPFVDHELIEFVSTIPYSYKLKWRSPLHRVRALFASSFSASERLDQSKAILRTYAKKLLPKKIVYRKKLGFPVPLDRWLREGLMDMAHNILLDKKTRERGLLRTDRVEKLLSNPQNLHYDFWGKKVWMLMNVELWYREFIDQKQ